MQGVAYKVGKALESLLDYTAHVALSPFAVSGCASTKASGFQGVEAKSDQESKKNEVGSKLRDIHCNRLSKYGDSYERSCRHYANQCIEQYKMGSNPFVLHPHLKLHPRQADSLSMSTIEKCMAMSAALVQELGPVSPVTLSPHDRPSPQLFFDELGWSARSAIYAQKTLYTRRMSATAAHIFADRGLLKGGEVLSDVIKGRVVAAHKSNSGRKETIIIMLDLHYEQKIQEQIRANVHSLYKGGLSLVTVENNPVDERIPFNPYCSSKPCCILKSRTAPGKIACEPGISVIGAENPELHDMHLRVLRRMNRSNFSNMGCDTLRLIHDHLLFGHMRSSFIARYTLNGMDITKQKMAALVIGATHLYDLKAIFDLKDINYVAIAVPAFDEIAPSFLKEEGSIDVALSNDPGYWEKCYQQ